MKTYDYISKDVKNNFDFLTKDYFITAYGSYNCKWLTLDNADSVINIINELDMGINTKQVQFIINNQNKSVLCRILCPIDENPDIFIFGDDNIPFTKECFKKL